jgi:hypothetical protein
MRRGLLPSASRSPQAGLGVKLRPWWATRGSVLKVAVERTAGGHRLCITNTGRGSAFGLSAVVKQVVHGRPVDPVAATAGGAPFPVHELPRGEELHVPLILLEAAARQQLEVVLRWTEGTSRRHRTLTFRPVYTW